MSKSDTPLKVAIEGEELVVRIGLDTLAFSAEHCPRLFDYDKHVNTGPPYCKVVDKAELARDVMRAFLDEEEDGSTPLSDCFDDAIVAAMDDGSLAFQDEESRT